MGDEALSEKGDSGTSKPTPAAPAKKPAPLPPPDKKPHLVTKGADKTSPATKPSKPEKSK